MKFAFVSTMIGYPWGGSEELWSQAAIQLKRDGHSAQALVVHYPQLSPKVVALAKQGIKLETYRLAGGPRSLISRVWHRLTLREQRDYARLQRSNPDLAIISQGYNAGGFEWAKVCRKASIPYVLIVQSNSEHMWFLDWEIEEIAAIYKAAQKVFCVSHRNLDLLRLQLGEPLEKGEVVWNPYNVSPEVTPTWPEKDGRWKLACVARLEVQAKAQELLLQVLARPEWRARPIELNFFGKGPHELTLRRLASMLQLDQVHFRGHVADIKGIWEENHMLVLPSRYEGLPLALVESMWCGRPAVVTDVAGNAEMCVDNETGFVVPAPTVSLLADTLERAWKRREDWQSMGQAARARAESQIPRNPIALFAEKLESCADIARHLPASATELRLDAPNDI
jgi:glycosyltransferase involved in cell wall biosynthesis